MKNFLKVGEFDPRPLQHALQVNPDLWNQNPIRTTFEGTPHGSVDDIWLRFNSPEGKTLVALGDELEAENYPAWFELHQARPVIFNLMRQVEGVQLGRVIVTRLLPGKTIAAHKDVLGRYSQVYMRYHCVIQGLPGSLFRCGDETICMRSGEVWWFNAHEVHECVNNSSDDRIHMLVDVRL